MMFSYVLNLLPLICLYLRACSLSVRFIRRGRAARRKPDLDDDGPSDFEELDSEVEMEDLKQWLSTQGCNRLGLVPGEALVRKFLPPGNLMELFEHYKSTQSLLGGHCVGSLGRPAHACLTIFWGEKGWLPCRIGAVPKVQHIH